MLCGNRTWIYLQPTTLEPVRNTLSIITILAMWEFEKWMKTAGIRSEEDFGQSFQKSCLPWKKCSNNLELYWDHQSGSPCLMLYQFWKIMLWNLLLELEMWPMAKELVLEPSKWLWCVDNVHITASFDELQYWYTNEMMKQMEGTPIQGC